MPALVENQRFERYRIIRHLGSGVSGESYEAEDTMLQRKVTLKLIHPWSVLADAARRQFFREMQSISLLRHPYLAAVLDYGELDGRLYVVRRYVTSGSLLSSTGRLWFPTPFSISNAIHYAHQLAQALEHVHRHGCLHGALTLSNILALRGTNIDGEPDFAPFLLADVGLANFVRRFGQPHIPLLPVTAAPEQLGKRVTPASDQFALAVILYFWLAGRPPYLGSPEEIEHLKLTETITPLSSLNSGITFEQEAILRRALAVYPEERYPSVLLFADTLLATLISSTHEAPTPALSSQPETTPEFELVPDTDPAFLSELETLPLKEKLEDEKIPEPELIPQAELQTSAISEPEPVLELEVQASLEFAEIPHTEPLLVSEPEIDQQPLPVSEPLLENEAALTVEPTPEPLPQPAPEPLPQPVPEPLPQPAPEPLPQPTPVPLPQTTPEPSTQPEPIPLPQPDPDPLPQPAPDIYQPVPQPPTEANSAPQTETSPEPASSGVRTSALAAWLVITAPGAEGPYVFMLEREETSLGRAGSDDALLDRDLSISRHHALLKQEAGRYIIYDLHSASGVLVNGQKLAGDTGHVLANGDEITIGSYELVFRFSPREASSETDEGASDKDTPDTKVGISS
ncbi:MAG: FHA domain-containing protein [Chloroflexi bacterium]|nr:FHA domain-containing protein [Chloroflexota bacterium]